MAREVSSRYYCKRCKRWTWHETTACPLRNTVSLAEERDDALFEGDREDYPFWRIEAAMVRFEEKPPDQPEDADL